MFTFAAGHCVTLLVKTMEWWNERSGEHVIGRRTTSHPRCWEVLINGQTGPYRGLHRAASERRWRGGHWGPTSFSENSTRKQRQERGRRGRKLHPLSERSTVAVATPRGTGSTRGASSCSPCSACSDWKWESCHSHRGYVVAGSCADSGIRDWMKHCSS